QDALVPCKQHKTTEWLGEGDGQAGHGHWGTTFWSGSSIIPNICLYQCRGWDLPRERASRILGNLEIPGVISCLLAIPQTCLAPSRRAEKANHSKEWNKGKSRSKRGVGQR